LTIMVEIAPGELIDKITILEIKLQNIRDDAKLGNVRREYQILLSVLQKNIVQSDELSRLIPELKEVNAELWRIEDNIRAQEKEKAFGAEFVSLARSVYRTNDRRAALKRQINDLLNSTIIEEKSYAEY
jgi:hypothetical protein